MIDISVIIPVYKGEKYISYLTDILKQNFDKFEEKYNMQCEAIFVNDYPEKEIKIKENSKKFVVFNLEHNRGIHGARVFGYCKSKGRYVIFLDQDDKISENYLMSQRQNIGIADAIICNGYRERICMNGRRAIYSQNYQLEKVKSLDNYILEGNQITSPGQVLIKKEAIPDLWINEIVKNNGADDYFLWILMLSKGCNFATNPCRIYTHIEYGSNTSREHELMNQSVLEFLEILKKNNILSSKEINDMQMKYCTNNAGKFLEMVRIYDYWMYLNKKNKKVEDYLLEFNYEKIAIYGLNYIGNRLYSELYGSPIKVIFGIDRDADGIEYDIPVFKIGDSILTERLNEIDMIIITSVTSYQNILQKLQEICNKPIVSIKSILLEMLKSV